MRLLPMTGMALILLAVLAGCSASEEKTAPKQNAAPIPVEVTTVGAAGAVQGALVSGVVRARQESPLAFVVPGRVSRLLVNEGDRVAAGQLLAQLETVEVDAGASAARAEVTRAEAELARQKELFAKGWVAKARLDTAEATASAARAQLASRGFAQRYARITAPTSGTVLARSVEPGQIVAAGTPVLTVSQTSAGYVLRVALTDAQMAALKPGQLTSVTLTALGGPPIAARVIELGGRGDPRTGTFEAELALPAMQGLRSGMLGEARLPATGGSSVLAIPGSAVFQARADEAFVYVLGAGNKAEARRITLGQIDSREVIVTSGIAAGERVISGGLARIRSGVVVAPREGAKP
jgi:RND family efflux transporter MFP subunit